MRISALIVFLVFCVATPDAIAEPTKEFLKCQRYLSGIADKHLKKANKLQQKHESALNKDIRKFFKRFDGDDGTAAIIRTTIDRISGEHDVAAVQTTYVDEVVETLRNHGDPNDPDYECPGWWTVESRAANWINNYEFRLENLRVEINDRLAIENLGDNEGLAIIAFYAFGLAENVRINRRGSLVGNIEFGPVSDGEYFRIVKVKAGTYNWDRISRETLLGKYYHDYGDRDFTFTVTAGKLNYTGVFVYDTEGNMARGSLNDRTSIVITMLEQRYPDLVDRFEIANGLVPKDKFINYYLAQRQRFAEQNASE